MDSTVLNHKWLDRQGCDVDGSQSYNKKRLTESLIGVRIKEFEVFHRIENIVSFTVRLFRYRHTKDLM